MLGLHPIDIAVLVLYFFGVAGIGFWTARTVGNLSDFVMPRRFGKFMMVMFTFGAGTHSDQAVSVASKTYTNGLSGIWYQWLWLFVTPFYWLIAPVMRRFRAITTADIFELRYDRSVGYLFAALGVVQLTVNIGVMLVGSSAVIEATTGGAVPAPLAISLMTVMFLIYGIAGGLSAAIITDFIQGILTIIFSAMLVPLILGAVGGLRGIHGTLQDPEFFSLVAPGEIGLFYIVVIAFNALVGIVAQPHTLSTCAAGRTELDGRVGFMFGSFVKRFCTVFWCLTGLAAVAHYTTSGGINPDHVYGMVAREFLPAVGHGLLGIFIAALLASVMSSCDAFMIAAAGLFTENMYKPCRPGRSDSHYLMVVRAASLLIVVGGLGFAFWLRRLEEHGMSSVVAGLEIFWKIAPMMGIAFWLGLFWRRATVAGAWASSLAAMLMLWLTGRGFFVSAVGALPFAEGLGFINETPAGPALYLPWQMTFYLAFGTIAGIVVSLLTPRPDAERLDRFYALARTPVIRGEEVSAACTLPADAEIPPRRNLIPHRDLEIPVPSALSVAGFFGGWVLVIAIIYSFVIISRP